MDLNALVNSTAFWIVLAVIVIALILIGVIVAGKKRRESKTISFDEVEEPKELTQQEKSGNYQAKGGFNFAQADAQPKQPEPVRRDKPAVQSQPKPEAAAAFVPPKQEEEETVVERAISRDDEPQVPTETVEQTPTEPAVEEPAVEEPVAEEQPVEPVEPEQPVEPVEPVEPEQPVEPAEPVERVDEVEAEPVDKQTAEAEEAAAAAAAAQESVGEARQEGAEVSDDAVVVEAPTEEPLDDIAPAAGRMGKLRGRLSRSQNAIGQGLLGILTAGDLDEDAWEEVEDTLIMADLGAELTMKVTDSLREKIAERGVETEDQARAMLRETLIEAARPEMDRSIKAMPNDGKPAVILVVGVNGTGKTTTTGKLARVLVSMGHSVVLGAADTFRAAAADQLETWGKRVGASTVRGKEGADPASVAFDAVATGVAEGTDVVLVDTAGRLHTSTGLMDQLGKVKRVVEKKSNVDEVLLVLDATVGQNGIMQARVFREVVDITGVVLTKLDGTAKGGIVFQVQEELGVPVKLVGLGEGADDLAPFEVESFVDALLG
ncbi:Signal recognition particle receptor FtsY [Corynebacterium afermentans subsp. afermentans]|uniref:Signal recognition particle receptor FtsY n=1 Tax=Corynebacterium afermentans TaxID=38286 RepID=A0A9X8NAJ5_9CORY|nr:signal recognition particle-docking protein FtsY [Corynebacterium afermentans]OAA15932.1 signal recognition particle-docking protein FtsY [Corynebacterium afermentans subsp. afermentans]WJY57030.1 Signal recognition particle receptor FtsY [Corynebacterium afermentans subsp. afermentans]SIP92152.1 signal recognition particle-docking protein FtsY [Corynebacterium afermentans]